MLQDGVGVHGGKLGLGVQDEAVAQGGPSKPYALETLATVYLRQGRHDDARKALDEAEASAAPGDHALLAQIADAPAWRGDIL